MAVDKARILQAAKRLSGWWNTFFDAPNHSRRATLKTPMEVHNETPPGVPVMKNLKSTIG